MQHGSIPLLLCVLLGVPGAAAAQAVVVEPGAEAAAAPRPAIVLLDIPGADKPREYQTDEMSISISRTLDGRGDTRGDVTISLGTVRPLDAVLLQWARQGEAGPDAARRVVITVPAWTGPASVGSVASAIIGPAAAVSGSPEARYELEGAKVVGFSASHSAAAGATQIMLQVSARRVSLNGVIMN